MDDSGRPLTAKEKRQEQLKRWQNSATDAEPSILQNARPRVKFHDGAVFLAACSSGDLKEVQILLNKGADINFSNVDGLTALHQACIDGNLDVVEFLVEHQAEIDQEDNEGWTPLHAAASCGFMDIAKYLIKKGANVAAVNSEGEVPLDIAEDDDMMDFLTQEVKNQGLDIDTARNYEQERMTIDAKQQLNTVSRGEAIHVYRHPKSGATALHVAAAKGYINVIKILLQAGLDVNLSDDDGWTALHAASHWSQEDAAKLLADKNANFKVRNKLGQTPFDVADEDMLEYLQELKEDQEKNKEKEKESNFIDSSSYSSSHKYSSQQEISSQEIKYTENKTTTIENNRVLSSDNNEISTTRSLKTDAHREDENSFSSDEEDADSSSSSEIVPTKPPVKEPESKLEDNTTPYRFSQNLARTSSASHIESSSSEVRTQLKHSASGTNMASSNFSLRHKPRPASLHFASDAKELRPSIMSADFSNSSRPVATAQPMQASKSTNGPVTPTERNADIKENSPDTWRSGLRKTGSFDKVRSLQKSFGSGSLSRQSEVEKSNSTSRHTEESSSSVDSSNRTARVAPILGSRLGSRTKQLDGGDSLSERFSNFQRSGSYGRVGIGAGRSASATPTAPSSFKRSATDSSLNKEEAVEATTNPEASDGQLDRRRSHLQPLRDEEAETKRKARSRRERQSRRSTQGVTLDVVEEAKKSIENKKRERNEAASANVTKKPEESTTESTNASSMDSSSLTHRRLTPSSSLSSSPRPVTLPSAYLPPNERLGSTAKTAPLPSGNTPSIQLPDSGGEDPSRSIPDDVNSTEDDKNLLSSAQQRKSAAQLRRRQRKERRSTGLPELRACEVGVDIPTDDDELKNDDPDTARSEKLKATASKYESTSLADRLSKRPLLNSDSDLPRYSDQKDYKKLYDEECAENQRLQRDLSDMKGQVAELKAKLSQAEESSIHQSALDSEKRRRRAAERRLGEVERELKNVQDEKSLLTLNEELKQQNLSLTRLVNRLSESSRSKDSLEDVETELSDLMSEEKSDSVDTARNKEDFQPSFNEEENLYSNHYKSTPGIKLRGKETDKKGHFSLYKPPDRSSSTRHYSYSGVDSERRDSGSGRKALDTNSRWSSARGPSSSLVDSFSNARQSKSSKTSSLSATDLSSGYYTIPPPAARSLVTTRTLPSSESTRLRPKASSTSRTTDRFFNLTDSNSSLSSSGHRSRGYESASLSRSRVPLSFSSAGSKRVGNLVDSYRSAVKP